jgi:hypothetical protein
MRAEDGISVLVLALVSPSGDVDPCCSKPAELVSPDGDLSTIPDASQIIWRGSRSPRGRIRRAGLGRGARPVSDRPTVRSKEQSSFAILFFAHFSINVAKALVSFSMKLRCFLTNS